MISSNEGEVERAETQTLAVFRATRKDQYSPRIPYRISQDPCCIYIVIQRLSLPVRSLELMEYLLFLLVIPKTFPRVSKEDQS